MIYLLKLKLPSMFIEIPLSMQMVRYSLMMVLVETLMIALILRPGN